MAIYTSALIRYILSSFPVGRRKPPQKDRLGGVLQVQLLYCPQAIPGVSPTQRRRENPPAAPAGGLLLGAAARNRLGGAAGCTAGNVAAPRRHISTFFSGDVITEHPRERR